MAEYLYTNNAASTLASGISSGDSSLTVASGEGSKFPSPSSGQQFNVTIVAPNGDYEIAAVTSRTSDTFSITRAQEGTSAQAFTAGSRVELRITADGLNSFLQEGATGQSITNPTITNYTEAIKTGNASTYSTLSLSDGTIFIITLDQASTTFTWPPAATGKSFQLHLVQDGTGGRAVTFGSTIWPGGTTPTITSAANKRDIFSFVSNGTSWYGVTVGQNY